MSARVDSATAATWTIRGGRSRGDAAALDAVRRDRRAPKVLATGLLNTVHLVQGTVARISSLDGLEWTNWAVIKIPAERRFLVRTYSDLGWRNVDVKAVDFTQTHEPLVLYDALGPVRDFTPGRAE